jgi:hypothetical protein
MLDTLRQAQLPVQEELGELARSETLDAERLWRLGKSVGDFSAEADALLVMMLERSAEDDLIDMAETLVDFYQDAEGQVDALLSARWG